MTSKIIEAAVVLIVILTLLVVTATIMGNFQQVTERQASSLDRQAREEIENLWNMVWISFGMLILGFGVSSSIFKLER